MTRPTYTYPEVPPTHGQFAPPWINSDIRISRGTTGAASELLACVELMRLGYHVYRAESPHAPFDLVAYRDGQFLRVEVKTLTEPGVSGGIRNGPNFPAPTNTEWDLIAIVGTRRVFLYERRIPIEIMRAQIRAAYGFPPLKRAISDGHAATEGTHP